MVGNPSLTQIREGLPVTRAQSREALLVGCEGHYFYVQPNIRPPGHLSGFVFLRSNNEWSWGAVANLERDKLRLR